MSGSLGGAVAGLAAAVALVAVAILGLRAAGSRRRRALARLRPAAELALAAVLASEAEPPQPVTRRERLVLADVALEALAELRGAEHGRLGELLARLGYVDEAAAALRARGRFRRRRAAELLALSGVAAAAPALRGGLDDCDALVRTICARGLAEIAGEPVGPIRRAVERDVAAVPGAAAAVVLALGAARPAELAELLGPDVEPRVRALALRVAGELRLSAHAPFLRAALADGGTVAASAARGAGLIGDVEAVAALEALVDGGTEPGLRVAAARALGSIGDPMSAPVLGRALGAQDWSVRSAAASALAQLGPPGIEALVQAPPIAQAQAKVALEG